MACAFSVQVSPSGGACRSVIPPCSAANSDWDLLIAKAGQQPLADFAEEAGARSDRFHQGLRSRSAISSRQLRSAIG